MDLDSMEDGMLMCKICKRVIRALPGKRGLLVEGECDECKAGDGISPPAPPPLSVLSAPKPPSAIPAQAPVLSPTFTDTIAEMVAVKVAAEILELFKRACAQETKGEEPKDAKNTQ